MWNYSPLKNNSNKPPLKCVVRLETEAFFRGKKYYYCKTLSYLKRKSTAHDYLNDQFKEEMYIIDYPEFIPEIEGLQTLPDGLYVLECHYHPYDETCSFNLEPYNDENQSS